MRPLIDARRADVEDYLERRQREWREDVTNVDEAFTRNRVRRRLLPELEETRVAVGQRVQRGSVVGSLSGNGSDASPVLHFELRVGGEPVNPLHYVQF